MRSCYKLGVVLTLLSTAATARAQMTPDNVGQPASGMPTILQGVGFRPELNAQMPLDASFKDGTGKYVRLRDYLHTQKPGLLAVGYYGCPVIFTALLHGV